LLKAERRKILMRQLILRNIILVIFVLFFTSLGFAATNTEKYAVRLVKLELYNNNTAGWVTVFNGGEASPSSELDIAAAAGSGQTVGTFFSGLAIPDGSYTKARATPSTSFVIRGQVNVGGTDYKTTSVQVDDGGGRTVSTASAIIASAQDCTVTVLAADMDQSASAGITFTGGPVTVTNGTADKKVKVFFNMSNCLTTNAPLNTVVYPGPPTVTMTAE